MGWRYRWRPSRSQRQAFARRMEEIEQYCEDNGISMSASRDSYYFSVNGEDYRVSNHTQAASDRGMYRTDPLTGDLVRVRDSYHRLPDGKHEYDRAHEITAGKTRIIEIHQALLAGKKINKRGYVID